MGGCLIGLVYSHSKLQNNSCFCIYIDLLCLSLSGTLKLIGMKVKKIIKQIGMVRGVSDIQKKSKCRYLVTVDTEMAEFEKWHEQMTADTPEDKAKTSNKWKIPIVSNVNRGLAGAVQAEVDRLEKKKAGIGGCGGYSRYCNEFKTKQV
jgi:hypothetical protein